MIDAAGIPPGAVRLAAPAMATRFELLLAGDDAPRLRAVGEAAVAEILECEQTLSLFRPGSLVSRINRLAGTRPVAVDADTFELLEEAVRVTELSAGTFDVVIGERMRALGFRDEQPRTDASAPAVRRGMLRLDPRERTVRLSAPGVEIDLGGIAKGHALDRAAAVVRSHGVRAALLHGGTSTVVAIGTPPGGTGWRVALGPFENAPVAELRDAALAVSAPHGREVVRGDERLGHVLDPRTGRPADRGTVCAAVLAPTARTADAWSTALLVAGADGILPPGLAARVAMAEPGDRVRWLARGAATLHSARFLDVSPDLEVTR